MAHRAMLVCMVFAVATALNAQSSYRTSTFSGTTELVPLRSGITQLNVELDNRVSPEFVLGVRIDSSAPASAALADVGYLPTGVGPALVVRRSASVTPVPRERYQVADDTIRITCSPDRNVTTAVFLRLASPAIVRVVGQQGLIASTHVADGVILQNGILSSAIPEGMHQLVLLVGGAGLSIGAPLAPLRGNSGNRVTLLALKTQLTHFEAPARSIPNAAAALGVLKLQIDENGGVVAVAVEGPGGNLLTQQGVETVKRWTFLPFLMQGRPVRVTGDVPFSIAPDGTFQCALDPKARVF